MKKYLWTAVAATTAAMLIACGSGGGVTDGDKIGAPSSGTSATAAAAKATYHQPTAGDFKLAVKVLEKKCFGSAGCNVTYRVDLTYTGASPLDPDTTYELTYEVRGLEDSAIGTMRITGDQYEHDEHEFGSTSSSSKKLSVIVVDVAAR